MDKKGTNNNSTKKPERVEYGSDMDSKNNNNNNNNK